MWQLIGSLFFMGGMAGVLYSWVGEQKEMLKSIEELLVFLKKSQYVMCTERIKVADYLERYVKQNLKNTALEKVLEEIVKRLSANTYPNGQAVWEEVFREEKEKLHMDAEVLKIIVQAGNGFFGYSRAENHSFLESSIRELEHQKVRIKEKQAQERKVWIPIGMLGSVMLVILFL